MNRTFLSFAVALTALSVFVAFLHAVFYFMLGRPLYTLQSFVSWFSMLAVVHLVASLLVLKYFAIRKFAFTLIAGVIATAGQASFTFLVIGMMRGLELVDYYIPVYMASLLLGILYGISLVLPPAGQRPLLRAAGIIGVSLNAFLLVVLSGFLVKALNTVEVEAIHQWTVFGGVVVPLLFLVHFIKAHHRAPQESLQTAGQHSGRIAAMVALALGALVVLFVAARFSTESLGAIAWRKQAPERIKRLAEPFEARTFVNGKGETLLYRFMRPVDYDSSKAYPIVVCLHHGGTHGDDNMKQVDGSPVAQLLSESANRTKYPVFLFVPQCPEGISWGGLKTLPAIDTLLLEGLADFEREFSIDKSRRYVTGVSGGGYGTWHLICSRPDMFAAAMPVCGGTDPTLAPRVVSVPVWAFHGAQDANVPVRHSRDMIDAIKSAGGSPRYTEFPEHAHNIWPQVQQTPGVLEWMFAQKRGD